MRWVLPSNEAGMARRTRYARRAVGLALCCVPIFLATASLLYGARGNDHTSTRGTGVLVIALVVACVNFYLSFIRGWFHRRRTGSLDGYRFVSGIPMIGTLLVLIGSVLGFGSVACAALGLLATALDTGGSVWFLVATWRDSAFWDDDVPPKP